MAEYQRDYEDTKEQKYEYYRDELLYRAMNLVESTVNKVLDDKQETFNKVLDEVKREIIDYLKRLEKMIKDVKFTRKSTIWIIFISAASLAVMIIQLLLSR